MKFKKLGKITENALNTLLKRYYERNDLQVAFPEVKTGNYYKFIDWAAGDDVKDPIISKIKSIKELKKYFEIHSSQHFFELSREEEDDLEKKIVWIFGSPRSGSTWLGTQLLEHPENITWNEPYFGIHFKVKKNEQDRDNYIFSLKKKSGWMPALRKFILSVVNTHVHSFEKNIIIKEPNGSGAADFILDCLSKSKLIFLLRDGRDVVDSLIDAHQANSWNPDFRNQPLKTSEIRMNAIETHSHMWNNLTKIVLNAYENHSSQLRHLVKYEDLRKNTNEELKKIYQFLGIKIDNIYLQKTLSKYDFNNIPKSEKGSGKFYRSASPGSWKKNFNKEEIKLMKSVMGKTLAKLGYDV